MILPLSAPGIYAGIVLVAITNIGDYLSASILGGPSTTMIGNIIQTQYVNNANYPIASALALILMVTLMVGDGDLCAGVRDANAAGARHVSAAPAIRDRKRKALAGPLWKRAVLPGYVVRRPRGDARPDRGDHRLQPQPGAQQAGSASPGRASRLEWYRRLFEIPDLTSALVTSLEIAALSTVIAVAIGTPAALALARYRFRGRGTGDLVILADIAAPSVVVGASLLGLFVYLGVTAGFGTILHRPRRLQRRLRRHRPAGAIARPRPVAERGRPRPRREPWSAFWLVTFPLIFPAILAAALLAFALSIDDFIITSFVAGQTLTFPLWVYGSVKVGIPPQVFAMGTLIFAVGVLIAIAGLVMARRSPKSA